MHDGRFEQKLKIAHFEQNGGQKVFNWAKIVKKERDCAKNGCWGNGDGESIDPPNGGISQYYAASILFLDDFTIDKSQVVEGNDGNLARENPGPAPAFINKVDT